VEEDKKEWMPGLILLDWWTEMTKTFALNVSYSSNFK
jgi:hypothetical protein